MYFEIFLVTISALHLNKDINSSHLKLIKGIWSYSKTEYCSTLWGTMLRVTLRFMNRLSGVTSNINMEIPIKGHSQETQPSQTPALVEWRNTTSQIKAIRVLMGTFA